MKLTSRPYQEERDEAGSPKNRRFIWVLKERGVHKE